MLLSTCQIKNTRYPKTPWLLGTFGRAMSWLTKQLFLIFWSCLTWLTGRPLWVHLDTLATNQEEGRWLFKDVFLIDTQCHIVIIHTYEYTVTLQYLYTMCDEKIGVTGKSITSDIYHFFVLGTFKTLSTSYFELMNCHQPQCPPVLQNIRLNTIQPGTSALIEKAWQGLRTGWG
jgi:hypothetical protein